MVFGCNTHVGVGPYITARYREHLQMEIAAQLANILPSVYNLILITMLAVVGITLGKFFFAKFNVPGLSPLFAQL